VKLLRDVLIACALAILCAVGVQAIVLLQAARESIEAATKAAAGADLMRVTLQAQLAGKYGLLSEMTAAARESRKTIDVLQKTSLAERAKVAAFSDASIQAVNDLDAVARNAATTVQSLQEATGRLGAVSVALEDDAKAAKPAIDNAAILLATLSAKSGDTFDRFGAMIGDVDARVKAFEGTERYVEETAKHLDGGASALEQALGFIRDDFAPRKLSFWARLADIVTHGALTAAWHWLPQRVSTVN
jgi:hypothetical protein